MTTDRVDPYRAEATGGAPGITGADMLARIAEFERLHKKTEELQAAAPPGEGQVIVLSDKTGQPRTAEDLDRMTEELQAVAERYGFKWSHRGTLSAVRRQFAEWQARLDCEDLAAMLAEYRERRDAEEADHGG